MANKKIKIPIDSSDVKKATKAVEDLAGATKGTKKEVTDLGATFEDVYGEGAKPLTEKLGELEDRMYALAEAGKQNTKEFKNLAEEAGRLRAVQQETDLVVDRLGQTLGQKLTGNIQKAVDAFTIAQSSLQVLGISSDDTAKLMEKLMIAKSVADSFGSLEESTGIVTKLGKAVKGTAAYQIASNAAQKAGALLTRRIAAAQLLWNAALMTNPIGAIVAAVTALIAGGYALIKMFKSSSDANKEAIKTNKELNKTLKKQEESFNTISDSLSKQTENSLAYAEATGASKEELRKLELQLIATEIAEAKKNKELAKSIALEAERAYMLAKSNGVNKEQVEALKETKDAAIDAYKSQDEAFLELMSRQSETLLRFAIEDEQAKTDARNAAIENQKKINEKAAEEEKARLEKEAQEKEQLDKQVLDSYQSILDETQDANEDYLQRKNEGEAYQYNENVRKAKESYEENLISLQNALARGVITETEYNQTKLALALQLDNELQDLDAAELKRIEEKANEEKKLADEVAENKKQLLREAELATLNGFAEERKELEFKYADELEKLKEALENELITKQEYAELEKQIEQDKSNAFIEIERREAEEKERLNNQVMSAKLKIATDTLQLVSEVSDLFAKGDEKRAKRAFQVDKAAKLASATISGIEATINAFKTAAGSPITAVFPAYPAIQAGLAAAFAATNIAKIATSKFESKGIEPSSPSSSGSAGGSASVQAAPTPPTVSLFGNAFGSSNQGVDSNQPGTRQNSGGVRAYVVESDITSTQNTLSRYRQRSEIG